MQQISAQSLRYSEWVVIQAHRKIQLYANTGDERGFYEVLKVVYSLSYQTLCWLWSVDGKELLTDKDSILNCWSEHFQTLFGASHTVKETVINKIPLSPV